MTWGFSMGLFFAVFLATVVATKVVRRLLLQRSLLDHPNDRSSHTFPTPRGGGLAVLIVCLTALVALMVLGKVPHSIAKWLCILTLLLGGLSWLDDIFSLNAFVRLTAHAAGVAVAMFFGLLDGPVFGGLLPPVGDAIITALIWVWFINLYNFMDGIDGISGVETVSISIGIVILIALSGTDSVIKTGIGPIAILTAGSAAGFLVFNWHPAKIFLGDVGSVPLGFVLGWLLLSLASHGYWAAALILPLYYLIDSTLTLIKRLSRGEIVWHAHREHFYQYAVDNGKSHSDVVCAIAGANLFLIALAVFASNGLGNWAFLAALGVVVFLIFWMLRRPPKTSGRGLSE
jgi:UDP-N-acetylmuramyl pentapeptide phosphotransferase/UDP-N-acetylglucosamine-1-phosphate transferase